MNTTKDGQPLGLGLSDGLGPLVAAALTAADEYAEAAGHAECWTGTRASYNQHLAEARAKVIEAIAAAVAAERERIRLLLRAEQARAADCLAGKAYRAAHDACGAVLQQL